MLIALLIACTEPSVIEGEIAFSGRMAHNDTTERQSFDERGRLVARWDTLDQRQDWFYDDNDRPIRIEDSWVLPFRLSLRTTETLAWDDQGRLVQRSSGDRWDTLNETWAYGDDEVLYENNRGVEERTMLDERGRPLTVEHVDRIDAWTWTWTWTDDEGQALQTDPRGTVWDTAWQIRDADNRIVEYVRQDETGRTLREETYAFDGDHLVHERIAWDGEFNDDWAWCARTIALHNDVERHISGECADPWDTWTWTEDWYGRGFDPYTEMRWMGLEQDR